MGRLIIWTESAFRKLDLIYGTEVRKSVAKASFTMPRAKMCNADFSRLIRSEEIVKAVRPPKKTVKTVRIHRNPLKKSALLVKLNPYAAVIKRAAILAQRKQQKMDDPLEAEIQVSFFLPILRKIFWKGRGFMVLSFPQFLEAWEISV